MAVEQLHVTRARVFFGQGRDRREEVLAAARALQVIEDLDRDRGVGGAEPVAFLWHAPKYLLRFADPGDLDHGATSLLGGDVVNRVAERDHREAEQEDDPDPAAARDRNPDGLGWGAVLEGRHLRALSRVGSPVPNKMPNSFDTSAARGKYRATRFQRHGRSAVANHLTPSELAEELQMKRQDVIGKCVQMGVPIFHGRIDKSLFQSSLRSVARAQASRARPS
jgi:hypothetical protein